jgi:peptidoglycan/LPS O-acetylase OafA/YrhL
MPLARVLIVDLLLILVFAAVGRRSHDEGSALAGTVTVAAPFMIGYLVAAVAVRLDRGPRSVRRGVVVALVAVASGLALRGTLFGRGLAPAFVIVAFATITALLVGWRLVAARFRTSEPQRA